MSALSAVKLEHTCPATGFHRCRKEAAHRCSFESIEVQVKQVDFDSTLFGRHVSMSSASTKTAPFGSWKSPITSDLIVAQSITLSELCLDGEHLYWLEGRPQEQGRYVVVRADADGRPTDITPPPYN